MYKLIKPILFKQDPEKIHEIILYIGKQLSSSNIGKYFRFFYGFDDKSLHTNVFKINFKNPVGLAAGFDKNGEIINFLSYISFGFVEIGSITAIYSEGNVKPRLFRLVDNKAIINRMGLNNNGVEEIYKRLDKQNFRIPFGINIAKTHDPKILGDIAIKDFCYTFNMIYHIGDYITINISCPNTKEGKTFEDIKALDELLSEINKVKEKFEYKKPLLVKLSPDLSYKSIDGIIDISERYKINGYVLCNTSSNIDNLKIDSKKLTEIGKGGLSGIPIRSKSTELIRYIYKQLNGNTNIIGVGGIFSAKDAYEKIVAGASLIQIYTGLIYEGVGLVKRINKGLVTLLKQNGFSSIKEAVGSDTL